MVVVGVQERCDNFGSKGTCRDNPRNGSELRLAFLTSPPHSDMLAFTDILLLVGSLALSLAILVPLTGALVRFRAHYNPKGLQLDPEGAVQPHTGPVIATFFAMLVRVYRIEVRFATLL